MDKEQVDSEFEQTSQGEFAVSGILEIAPKGFGFLRSPKKDYMQKDDDVYVSPQIIDQEGIRYGVLVDGFAAQGEKGPQLTRVEKLNGLEPKKMMKMPEFSELKAINPEKKLSFETKSDVYTTRTLDLVAPVGLGQRGLIIAPPRSGKTTLLMDIGKAMVENYRDVHLIFLLVDERSEEVTEFKKSFPNAEIYASSNDMNVRAHCRIAEIAIERGKRLVEMGKDVFLLMDSITRLARAYNRLSSSSQRKGKGFQTGGISIGALEKPRRIFAAARNTREAGSLTILSTALVETNSRADEAIFQEFKGTGNMELFLNRRIAEQYIYPAVDIGKSGTRCEDILLSDHALNKTYLLRRGLSAYTSIDAMEKLLLILKKFKNNSEVLLQFN